MTQEKDEQTSRDATPPRGEDVTAGKGRRDEVGKTGIYPGTGPFPEGETPILTPADISKPREPKEDGVRFSGPLKGSERLPGEGNGSDEPESDLVPD